VERLLKEHLLAIKWDPSTPPFAFLFLRNIEENPEEVYKKFLEIKNPFNITMFKEKICIGHSINKENYHLCSNFTEEQYARCYTCEQNDFEKCFLFCDASKPYGNCAQNLEAYEYCVSHSCSVYLALIANNVKVGVSFNPLKRWMNQGADAAIEVFKAENGLEARRIEKEISSELNIPQTIRKTQKARKLNFDLSKSLPAFRELKDKVVDYLEKTDYVMQESELLYKERELSSYYGDIPNLNVNPILNEVEKTKQITGELVGVKGKLAVTRVNNSYYVSNLSKMIGHLISFSEAPLKLKGQKSLSDFLIG
jgi:hypothetical protein